MTHIPPTSQSESHCSDTESKWQYLISYCALELSLHSQLVKLLLSAASDANTHSWHVTFLSCPRWGPVCMQLLTRKWKFITETGTLGKENIKQKNIASYKKLQHFTGCKCIFLGTPGFKIFKKIFFCLSNTFIAPHYGIDTVSTLWLLTHSILVKIWWGKYYYHLSSADRRVDTYTLNNFGVRAQIYLVASIEFKLRCFCHRIHALEHSDLLRWAVL